MDDDREAFEFAYALYLARQVDREAAQMIAEAAEAGVIQINEATDLFFAMPERAIPPICLQAQNNGLQNPNNPQNNSI